MHLRLWNFSNHANTCGTAKWPFCRHQNSKHKMDFNRDILWRFLYYEKVFPIELKLNGKFCENTSTNYINWLKCKNGIETYKAIEWMSTGLFKMLFFEPVFPSLLKCKFQFHKIAQIALLSNVFTYHTRVCTDIELKACKVDFFAQKITLIINFVLNW